MPGRTPHDLALFVYGRIAEAEQRPSIEILDELFHTLFLASLRTEEGSPITCSIAYVNPKKPDPDPPPFIRDPRWTYAQFSKPVQYNVTQLTKLALAADPGASSLVVFPDRKGVLQIWGLIDQQAGFQSFLSHEREGGWSPPGLIHVQILGSGHLVVMDEFTLIAELNGDHLVEDTVDVFQNSVINKKFFPGFERRMKNVSARVVEAGFVVEDDMISLAYAKWITLIRRILLRARVFGVGGAFLFTDSKARTRLNTKYKICYDRIPTLFENQLTNLIIEYQSRESLCAEPNKFDPKVYFADIIAGDNKEDASEAIAGAVSYIASLSRVDGLVFLDYDLVVHGFGCEITVKGDENCKCFHANHASPTKGKLRRLDLQRFGTRHRSMIRYCTRDLGAVGFVVSHDGPVRAVSQSTNRLYFWDNVQLARRISGRSKTQ